MEAVNLQNETVDISKYKILISNLPVRQQCFTIKRNNWKKSEEKITWLKQLNDKLFDNQPTIKISRQDIFETVDIKEVIFKTIYWGYPSGMRGNHFIEISKKIDLLVNTFSVLKENPSPTTKDFNELTRIFKEVSGLGISTYSKLLYFLQINFDQNPCFILDQRLINVFSSSTYSNFKSLDGIYYGNAEKKYLEFSRLINDASKKLDIDGENIEQFLYIFGNNLKLNLNKKEKLRKSTNR